MTKSVSRPETFDDLQKAIVDSFPKLSKRLQQIAGYALDNPSEFALETVATVSQRAGVQPSSLIRFGKGLGFSGYSEMQRVFRRRLTAAMPDYPERLRSLGSEYPKDTSSLLDEFVQADIVGLRSLLQQPQTGERIEQAFTLLASSDTVYLVAHRRSFPVACYLSYALSQLNVRNVLVDGVGGMFFQQASHASSRDVMLAVSTKSYSPDVVQVVREAAERGVQVVAITDSPLSPLAEQATVSLEVQQPSVHLFRSLAVQMTLAITLIVGLGRLLEAKRGPPLAAPKKKKSPKRAPAKGKS
jgi:DNA-binding MurR/RpiR family transcriptional regulator